MAWRATVENELSSETSASIGKDESYDHYTQLQPPSIALIDDDPLFGELFKEYAHSKGFQTQYYVSPAHVANINSLRHYHVVLIDMELGTDLSGLDFAHTVRAALPEVPIVLISGDTMVGFDSRPDCVDAFVTKRMGLEGMLQVATDVYKRLMQ